MRIGFDRNEYGTLVSAHCCRECLERYTVCPPAGMDFGGCQSVDCSSYDAKRDVDKLIGAGVVTLIKKDGNPERTHDPE